MLSTVKGGGTRLDLQLNPQELGSITVSLSVRNGEVSAVIRSEKSETNDMRHAQGPRFFQIKQAGPFINAAFRQGPGLCIKNASKATVIRPCKNFPLVGQRIKLLQLTVIRPKIQVSLRPARFAAHATRGWIPAIYPPTIAAFHAGYSEYPA